MITKHILLTVVLMSKIFLIISPLLTGIYFRSTVYQTGREEGNVLFNDAFNTFYLRLYGRKEGRKEGNVLFTDALNTFYLRLCGVRHMVKDHSDNKRGNLLPPHGLLFPICSKVFFICIIPHTSRGALAGTRNSSMGSL